MKNRYRCAAAILAAAFLFLPACGKKAKGKDIYAVRPPQKLAKIERAKQVVKPRYEYRGDRFRDFLYSPLDLDRKSAFASTSGTGKAKQSSKPDNFDFDTVQLRGFLHAPSGRYAIVGDNYDNAFVVREGKIYTMKKKEISGVSAVFKKDSVIMTAGGRIKELRLRKK